MFTLSSTRPAAATNGALECRIGGREGRRGVGGGLIDQARERARVRAVIQIDDNKFSVRFGDLVAFEIKTYEADSKITATNRTARPSTPMMRVVFAAVDHLLANHGAHGQLRVRLRQHFAASRNLVPQLSWLSCW